MGDERTVTSRYILTKNSCNLSEAVIAGVRTRKILSVRRNSVNRLKVFILVSYQLFQLSDTLCLLDEIKGLLKGKIKS